MARSSDDVVWVGPRSGLQYRNINADMADALEALERASFPTAEPADLYDRDEFSTLAQDFPEGCFAGFDGDEAVAMGVGLRVHFDLDDPQHTIHDIMPGDGSSGHHPDGSWYYGTSIAVRTTHRRMGIGQELYELRKDVVRSLGLDGIVAGGVLPGYADRKHEMTADEYVEQVKAGKLYDPTLTFQIANGFEAGPALRDYILDPKVDNWACLIVWHNDSDASRGRR